MKIFAPYRSTTAALTLPEVVITVGVILILAFVFVPAFMSPTGSRTKSARIACVNNLKQIGLAFRVWSNDSSPDFPMARPVEFGGVRESLAEGKNWRTYQVLSNELSLPKTVICPADSRLAATDWAALANSNVSYFVGLDAKDTKPNMILAGDRNLARDGRLLTGVVSIGTNSPLTWTSDLHQKAGNIGLADGSVQQVTTKLLAQQLTNSGDTTNRLVFPQ